jgi:predicted dienelactone hydrolase
LNARLGGALVALLLIAVACAHKIEPPPRVEATVGSFGVGFVTTPIDAGADVGGQVPTTVFYPARSEADQPARANAAPAGSDGPFPLVVFVHGAGAGVQTYRSLIEAIAARGYVVAAPQFPESSSPDIVGSNRALDLAEPQALALPAIIERVRSAGIGGVPTASIIDPDQLHLVGHSLGAATVLAAAFNSCCRLPDVTSVTAMSTVLLDTSGEYDISGAPVMFIHGQADQVIPVEQAEAAYEQADSPKYLVELGGTGHYEFVQPGAPAYGAVVVAITAMLAGSSGGQPVADGLEPLTTSEAITLQLSP